MPRRPLGLLAEFPTADAVRDAAMRVRDDGYDRVEAFTPFPVEGLAQTIGFETHAIGWLSIAGGLFGLTAALALEVLTNLNYPINVGGRPLIAIPAFLVIGFELMILFAVLFPVVGMLRLNDLPRLHHPLFDSPRFRLATDDRFFLYVDASDGRFDKERTHALLGSLGPISVEPVWP